MLFELKLTSRKKVNKALSRFENELLLNLIQPAECLLSALSYMLPHIDSTDEERGGVLCFLKTNTGLNSFEVQFLSTIQEKCLFRMEVATYMKIDRPRPNLIVVDNSNHSNVNIFKFISTDDAKSFYALLNLKLCQARRSSFAQSISKTDISVPSDFRNLDVGAWNTIRQLQEPEPSTRDRKFKWRPHLPRLVNLNGFKRQSNNIQPERAEDQRSFLKSISNAVRKVSLRKSQTSSPRTRIRADDQAPLLNF